MMGFIKELLLNNQHLKVSFEFDVAGHALVITVSDVPNKHHTCITIDPDLYDQVNSPDDYIIEAIKQAAWKINKKRITEVPG